MLRRLVSWDGNWYLQIGNAGYSWHPAARLIQQDIAFFPVQGLIDRFAKVVFGAHQLSAIIGIGVAMGIASVFSFEAFARRVIPDRAVAATWLFALWPTAFFWLMGYPTGLISICVIEALHASWRGKKYMAAGWLGLGTATAPTVAFVAVAMALMQGRRDMRRGGASWVFSWGLWCSVAFSGLLLFMAYQAVAFHDARAFMQAQDAWGTSGGLAEKLLRLASPRTYLVGIRGSVALMYLGTDQMIHGAVATGLYNAQTGLQIAMSHLWFWLIFVGLIRFTKECWHRCQEIALSGWFVYLGYVWFLTGNGQGVEDSGRLLLPAMAFFFGLAPAGARHKRFPGVLVCLAVLNVIEVAFEVSGYNIL